MILLYSKKPNEKELEKIALTYKWRVIQPFDSDFRISDNKAELEEYCNKKNNSIGHIVGKHYVEEFKASDYSPITLEERTRREKELYKKYTQYYIEQSENELETEVLKALPHLNFANSGSCVLVALELTKYLTQKGINNFKVMEGWVKPIRDKRRKLEHTWIEFDNGDKLDPSFIQFIINLGINKEELMYHEKVKEVNNPQDYMNWFKEKPLNDWYIKEHSFNI